MQLTKQEQKMLDGAEGYAVQKSMEILTALGDIYGAKSLIESAVSKCQAYPTTTSATQA